MTVGVPIALLDVVEEKRLWSDWAPGEEKKITVPSQSYPRIAMKGFAGDPARNRVEELWLPSKSK
jgi:hypothetical protein